MTNKILIVDDETDICDELLECLTNEGYECMTAASGEEGLNLIRDDLEISIVLTDLQMPGRAGLTMIGIAQAELEKGRVLEFVVITGHGNTGEAITALKLGVMDFLQKPIDVDHVIHVVRRAEELVLLKRARHHYQEALKADVEAKTVEIRKLHVNLEAAYAEALDCLAAAAEYKDPETGDHIHRVGKYTQLIANELGWSKKRQEMILLAAPLHDVGKIGTPESILLKPGKLSAEEIAIMKQHTEIGHRILSSSTYPVMMMASNIARGHHERWDGSGYPHGLTGAEIPIEARITTLGDVYDALRSARPYKPAFDHKKTLSIMLDGDGRTCPSHFDPELLAIFREKSDEFDSIFHSSQMGG
ncbi:MAG TPA: response regulator [Porticoccus sp.]|nr:response regulator [Porticoccus sp.]